MAQLATVAERLGVVDPPRTEAELAAQLDAFRPELSVSPAARDTIGFLLHQPPVPWTLRVPYAGLTGCAVATLPPWARELVAPGSSPVRRAVARPAGRLVTGLIRWSLARTPDAPEGEPFPG